MFSDYQKRVIACYREKQRNGSLAPNLTDLKPAKMRDECLMVYMESTKAQDEKMLRTFFGSKGDRPDYNRAMEQVNTDRFKPLIRFLNGITDNTNSTNIELLAWLIGYEPRPFQFSYKTQPEPSAKPGPAGKADADWKAGQVEAVEAVEAAEQVEAELLHDIQHESFRTSGSEVNQSSLSHSFTKEKVDRTETRKIETLNNRVASRPTARRVYSYLFALTAFLTGGAYLYNAHQPDCMCWEGNSYRTIDCDEKIPGVMILPLDAHKIKHFKRIAQPDTLDYHHVGRTWYIKAGMDSVEFFTDAGTHPVSQKDLRPVTKYIIRKYVKGGG